ncbi:TOBE-like domain-containing protein [Tumidithrix elongata RA019]|uniref:ABC-type quaternary amine transporter n=1 Tax=Tumidithrix elongata BACA0141 TaxID=2716417 RepID=A0AAW9PVW9_9CYAN|nr:TOBE-like domain-containing protein [Tumidithrix elongata RA019]
MGILVENVSKQFGDFQALDNINLEVKNGSLTALLGPSGSGKSTLLRLIAGLETPDRGKIFITGKDFTSQDPRDRNIGFVFQHYALFKHMSVRQNIAFGLEIRKNPKQKTQARVDELLELVQLKGLGNRYPSQLSGGQRQRVALARALAVEPQVLLLDEPFGALDAQVRKELRAWLRRLHDEVHVTSVFVTHDQEEAMEVSDEIVVMNKGKIEQIGSPADVYDNPATSFVMSFIGPVNIVPAHNKIAANSNNNSNQDHVFIRPRDILIETVPNDTTMPARIDRLIHLGWEVQVELVMDDGQVLTAHLSRDRFDELQLQPQQVVHIKPKDAKAFPLNYSI